MKTPKNSMLRSMTDTIHYMFAENDSVDSNIHNTMLSPAATTTLHLNDRFLKHSERHVLNGTQTLYDIEEDDDYYTYDNNTYTTSVSIRVTPIENFFTSWGILFGCFVVASCFALYQLLYVEDNSKLQGDDAHHNNEDVLSEETTRRSRRRIGTKRPTIQNRDVSSSPESNDQLISTSSVNNTKRFGRRREISTQYEQFSAMDGDEAANVISSADETRSMFRRILLLAMISRMMMMPIMIWSNPQWYQFVGDTLPEMVFASAWTLLVTFLVQIVGIASGSGTNASPGIVIQATAYIVYLFLIGLQLVDKVATILLYALLCCIYAALLGVVLYFFPMLLSLLRQSPPPPPVTISSDQNSSAFHQRRTGTRDLYIRLIVTMTACVFIFLVRTVGYAKLVIMPPRRVYWWWNYGMLELLPTCIFLIIMHPRTVKVDRDSIDPDLAVSSVMHEAQLFRGYRFSGSDGQGRMRRLDSSVIRRNEINPLLPSSSFGTLHVSTPPGSSSNENTPNSTEGKQIAHETTAMLKKTNDYGSHAAAGSASGGNAVASSATVAAPDS